MQAKQPDIGPYRHWACQCQCGPWVLVPLGAIQYATTLMLTNAMPDLLQQPWDADLRSDIQEAGFMSPSINARHTSAGTARQTTTCHSQHNTCNDTTRTHSMQIDRQSKPKQQLTDLSYSSNQPQALSGKPAVQFRATPAHSLQHDQPATKWLTPPARP